MMPLFGFRSLPAGSPLALVDTYAKTLGVGGEFPPPVGDVNVRVLGQTLSGSFRSFPRPATAFFQRTPSGYFNLTGKIRMANGGVVKLSQGNFRFEVDGRFYRKETRDLVLNPDRTDRVQIDLVPNEYYPFPPSSTLPSVSGPCRLHGSLHTTGGDPLAGVLVTVLDLDPAWPFRAYLTEKSGGWMVVFPDKFFQDPVNPLDITIEKPVRVQFDLSSGAVILPTINVVAGKPTGLIETSLRGQVVDARGAAIPSAVISVSGRPETSRTNKAGEFSYFFPLTQGQQTVAVTARTPGGGVLSQPVQLLVRGRAVVPTFRFT